jgi:hypothetical protein
MTSDVPGMAVTPTQTFLGSFGKGLRKSWLYYSTFVILVMAVAGLIISINSTAESKAQQRRLSAIVECQNRYNEINNERTRRITDAASKERAAEFESDTALYNFVNALAKGASEQERVRVFAILTEKLAAQQQVQIEGDRERALHPVPPPPDAFCGIQK